MIETNEFDINEYYNIFFLYFVFRFATRKFEETLLTRGKRGWGINSNLSHFARTAVLLPLSPSPSFFLCLLYR